MKIVRSILAVVLGLITAMIFIMAIETANGFIHPPPDGKTLMEFAEEMEKATPAAKAWMQSIPLPAMVLLQIGWAVGAFVGGGVSAWVAGRGRVLHAWLIGAFIVAMTIVNLLHLKATLDYAHPDWLIVIALLVPMPLAMLAGKFVSKMIPPPPAPANVPEGAIQAGEPPPSSSPP